ncbi:MAG: hypothetical protein K0R66_1188 [Gammaproteobacteria bacterium]|jgi:D-alanyl-D-alanine carboxypeptidase|nr:hypothetical protein [Gammaproteobacteria bacterium]
MKFIEFCGLGLILLACSSFADSRQSIQNFINTWRVQNHIPAVSLSISLPNQTVQVYVSGTTTLTGSIPVNQNSLFGVGSITKTFVAVCLLQLQEQHELNLDEKIGKWFPQYPRWQNISIRQLLNMTSGINNYSEDSGYQQLLSTNPQQAIKPDVFINMAYAQPDYFSPGKGWYYSNTNYLILGEIIEKVTGRSLNENFQSRFFKPLHLNHTYYSDSGYPASVIAQMARGYSNGQDVTLINPSYTGASGSMVMGVNDLLIWTQALFTPGKLLSQASLKQFMTTVPVPNQNPRPFGSGYGLGVFSSNIKGLGTVWWYSGAVEGYSSVYYWIPSKQITIAAQISGWSGGQFALLMAGQPFFQKIIALSLPGV